MFKTYRTFVAKLLAVCLFIQPALMLATAPEAQPAVATEQPISAALKSPLKKEYALLSQFSTTPLLNNSKLIPFNRFLNFDLNTELMRAINGRLLFSWDDLNTNKYFSAEEYAQKQTRIQLFNNLQFANRDGQNSIALNLGKTITKSGQVAFFNLVAQPHTDWELTKRRQNFVRALIENPSLLKHIQSQLVHIKAHEEYLAKRMPFAQAPQDGMTLRTKLTTAAIVEALIYFKAGGFNKVFAGINIWFLQMFLTNKLCSHESIGGPIQALTHGVLAGGSLLAALAALAYATNFKEVGTKSVTGRLAKSCESVLPDTITKNALFKKKKNAADTSRTYDFNARAYKTLLFGAIAFGLYKFVQFSHDTNKDMFTDMKGIAQIVRATKELQNTLAAQSNTTVRDFLDSKNGLSLSASYQELASKTQTSTFDPSTEFGIFSVNLPRVQNSFNLLMNTIEDFSKVLRFYGELDAYAAMAQLYLDTQNTTNQFGEPVNCCFVDLIEESEESILRAQGMWHPIIPQTVVRTNSITLGGSAQTPRNAIITGPNAAGKSVSLKALLVNIVLGQTFGIACAESFAFTPYTKIIARFTSADNTAGGQSKFMLEAADVVATLKELETLQPGEKAFVVTDELFSGTEVRPAILLSAELCAEIATMKNVSYLLATHYKDLTQLKKTTNNAFENYKVTAFVDENSNVTYPFKLAPGIGDVNVAFDIFLDQMRKQGVANERLEAIIKNARGQNIATQG